MQVRVNLNLAKQLAKEAISDYLFNPENEAKGKLRAKKIGYALLKCKSEQDTLIILLSLFGKPDQTFTWGRSKRLANLIANNFITGEYDIAGEYENSLASQVFNDELLAPSKSVLSNFTIPPLISDSLSLYNKTEGVRDILQHVLNTEYKATKNEILHAIKSLRLQFDSSSSKMSLEAFTSSEYHREIITAATMGALSESKPKTTDSKSKSHISKLPSEVIEHISLFFTKADQRMLVQVNKAAQRAVKDKEATTKYNVF